MRSEDPLAAGLALYRTGALLEAVSVLEPIWRVSAAATALFEEILGRLPAADRLYLAPGLDDLASSGDSVASALHARFFPAARRIVGTSAGIRRVRKFLYREALTGADLLIWGESGVGVSLCVDVFHHLWGGEGEVQQVTLGTMAASLREQELRRLEEAPPGSTLYCSYSQPGDISLSWLDRLRTACSERQSRFVLGGLETDDGWPADLWSCWVPPLRQRLEDLPELSRELLARQGAAEPLSQAALASLEKRRWGGNVRELAHCLWRAQALREAGTSVSDCLLAMAE